MASVGDVESWVVVGLHIALLVEEVGVDLLETAEEDLLAWADHLHRVVSVGVAGFDGSLHLLNYFGIHLVENHRHRIAAVALAVDLDSSWPRVEVE